MLVWINEEFVSPEKACVPLLSHGFSRGLVVFDVLLITSTDNGPAFVALDEHIDRFIQSCALMYMKLPYTRDEILSACRQAARKNQVQQGACKIFAYDPQATWGTLSKAEYATVAIYCGDYADFGVDPSKKKKALNLGISSFRKLPQDTVPIKAKVAGYYVGAYLTSKEAANRGYDEAIMADSQERICEGRVILHLFCDGRGAVRSAGQKGAGRHHPRDSHPGWPAGWASALRNATCISMT